MTPRELINKLLDMPLDKEITLFSPEKHIDEYGIESIGYIFHITDVNLIDGIVFDDWRCHPCGNIAKRGTCCKDCRHRDPEDKKCDCGHTIIWQMPRPDDWYCADFEKRKEE